MGKNLWCAAIFKKETGKRIINVVPIRIGAENIISLFDGCEILHPCETKKEAYAIATSWRESYRQNSENEQVS